MAMEQACFDLLYYGNDGHFPSFMHENDEEETLFSVMDADFAEELQLQEALMASLISSEISSNVSSSSSPMTEEEIPVCNTDLLLDVKEKGESSLSYCEICLERKEADQLVTNESCVQACCLDCSKTNQISKEQWCCKELSKESENDSAKPFTGSCSNNPPTKPFTNQAFHQQFFKDLMKDTVEARVETEEECVNTLEEGEERQEYLQQSNGNASNTADSKEGKQLALF